MGQAGAANEQLPYQISIASVGIGNLDLSIRRNAERYSVRAEGSYRVMFWSGAIKGEAEGVIGARGPGPGALRDQQYRRRPLCHLDRLRYRARVGPLAAHAPPLRPSGQRAG
jgi:hypothetical protein